ncbi:MAG: RNA-binding S4 domain-containing protein [Saprospiraceae bacterium]|nr:RNA-binding S4 domain-containing protein [Saprospiraceae bacterium]
MKDVDKVRVDKWLWAVRLFKSRSLSTDTVKSGKVKLAGKTIKASFHVNIGDVLEVKKNGFLLQIKVDKKIDKRVSAPLAAECFTDLTPAEELNKYMDWFVGKGKTEYRDKGDGRPTKKERREIDDFKLFYLEEGDEDF